MAANERKTLRARAWAILDGSNTERGLPLLTNVFILSLILLNVLAVALETVDSFALDWAVELQVFEAVSVTVFTVEYLLRLWSCPESEEYRRPWRGRLKWALTPMAMVDLVAVVPFYLPMLFAIDTRFVRALRLLRLFRLFKASQYTRSFGLMRRVLVLKRHEILITLFVTLVGLLLTSSLMYFVERDLQPERFGSIPQALWWGAATLTTVGYGDVVPLTPLGKLLGALTALFGVGLFGMPAAILADGFRNVLEENHPTPTAETGAPASEAPTSERPVSGASCPHCGGGLEISVLSGSSPASRS